ncbi:MAG: COG1470 family protein [Thermoanaerobaculia bacterium]
MRKLPVVLLLLFCSALVHGQESETVALVTPAPLDISLASDVTHVRVFYMAPKDSRITITDAGPLVAGSHIGFVRRNPRDYAFDLKVDVSKLAMKAGETHSGSLVFKAGNAETVIPFTVSRPAPAFTATATPTDLCIACGEPRLISVQITNSGQAPLGDVTVGTVLMSDASRGHRWILPRAKGRRCGEPNTKAVDVDGKLVVEPCSSVNVDLRPGEARTISIAVKPPQYAGDYATTIELSADGVPTTSVSLVTRVRGPWGGSIWPPVLFTLTVLLGFGIAQLLEKLFGAGGVERRTRALVSLLKVRDELYRIREWARELKEHPLPQTLARLDADTTRIAAVADDTAGQSPELLENEAKGFIEILEKRRRLQQRVGYALANKLEDKIPALDAEPDRLPLAEYDARLEQILVGGAQNESMRTEMAEQFQQENKRQTAGLQTLEQSHKKMILFRGVILAIISLITAYGMFYANGCNFGSLANYFTVFLWGLGLTQAGNALTSEVRARATAQPAPPPGGANGSPSGGDGQAGGGGAG